MSVDSKVERAQQALGENEPGFASELFESAARELIAASDALQGAKLLSLAAQYSEDASKEDGLLAEVQELYLVNDDLGRASDTAMIRATRLAADGKSDLSRVLYRKAYELASRETSELCGRPLDIGEVSIQLNDSWERMLYCRRNLNLSSE